MRGECAVELAHDVPRWLEPGEFVEVDPESVVVETDGAGRQPYLVLARRNDAVGAKDAALEAVEDHRAAGFAAAREAFVEFGLKAKK